MAETETIAKVKRQPKITAEQFRAIEAVAEADKKWRDEQRIAYAEAQAEADRRIASSLRDRDEKIHRAVKIGVKKSWLQNHEVLATTYPRTVDIALERLASQGFVTGQDERSNPFIWIDKTKMIARISYRNFPTEIQSADYPDSILGVVQIEGDTVKVREDPTIKTEPYKFAGWLDAELRMPDGRLLGELMDWAAENA